MDNYFSMSIQGIGLQVLETVYIINSTKNFDTLKSRYELLIERIGSLREAASNPQYLADINNSANTYKSMYFDRPLQDIQLSATLKPSEFDVQNFYCNSIINCIAKFVDEQLNEIKELKSENAKSKRRLKVLEKVNLAKTELLNKCSSTPYYSSALNSIDTLTNTLS